MDHAEHAAQLFREGYNCAQAVAMAFCPETGLPPQTAARMASPFGGGMGRMREVCGAVSGMLLAAGMLYGYDDAADTAGKRALYAQVQAMAADFRAEHGTIICRELLMGPPSDPAPTPRTAEFYQKRPCVHMVMTAARILEAYIEAHPLPTAE